MIEKETILKRSREIPNTDMLKNMGVKEMLQFLTKYFNLSERSYLVAKIDINNEIIGIGVTTEITKYLCNELGLNIDGWLDPKMKRIFLQGLSNY